MRLSLFSIFLTFVLISPQVWSAPHKALPKSMPSASDQNEFDEDPGPTKKEPTHPTYPNLLEPSNLEIEKVQTTYSPRGLKDLNFHLGTAGGYILSSTEQKSTRFLGMRYIPYETFEKSWDYTVNAHRENLIGLAVGHRWHFSADQYFNSYYRLSLENFIDTEGGLSGLIDLRHIKAMVSLGVPDFFEFQRRIVGEFGAGYGLGGLMVYLQIGCNFNF